MTTTTKWCTSRRHHDVCFACFQQKPNVHLQRDTKESYFTPDEASIWLSWRNTTTNMHPSINNYCICGTLQIQLYIIPCTASLAPCPTAGYCHLAQSHIHWV